MNKSDPSYEGLAVRALLRETDVMYDYRVCISARQVSKLECFRKKEVALKQLKSEYFYLDRWNICIP
jgi:hypothetical protein